MTSTFSLCLLVILINLSLNYYVKNLRTNDTEDSKNMKFVFIKEYSYCNDKFCYGLPFISKNNSNFLLCATINLEKNIGKEICHSLLFDNFYTNILLISNFKIINYLIKPNKKFIGNRRKK